MCAPAELGGQTIAVNSTAFLYEEDENRCTVFFCQVCKERGREGKEGRGREGGEGEGGGRKEGEWCGWAGGNPK